MTDILAIIISALAVYVIGLPIVQIIHDARAEEDRNDSTE